MDNIIVLFASVCVLFSVDCVPVVNKGKDNGNKITFSLPRQMVLTDNITLSGLTTSDRKKVTLGLVKGNAEGKPDYNNVPCQINLYFPHGDNTRHTATVNSIVNSKATKELDTGYEVEYLLEGLSLHIRFDTFPECEGKKIQPVIGVTPTQYTCNWSEDIHFIMIEGDVQNIDVLNFQLG